MKYLTLFDPVRHQLNEAFSGDERYSIREAAERLIQQLLTPPCPPNVSAIGMRAIVDDAFAFTKKLERRTKVELGNGFLLVVDDVPDYIHQQHANEMKAMKARNTPTSRAPSASPRTRDSAPTSRSDRWFVQERSAGRPVGTYFSKGTTRKEADDLVAKLRRNGVDAAVVPIGGWSRNSRTTRGYGGPDAAGLK